MTPVAIEVKSGTSSTIGAFCLLAFPVMKMLNCLTFISSLAPIKHPAWTFVHHLLVNCSSLSSVASKHMTHSCRGMWKWLLQLYPSSATILEHQNSLTTWAAVPKSSAECAWWVCLFFNDMRTSLYPCTCRLTKTSPQIRLVYCGQRNNRSSWSETSNLSALRRIKQMHGNSVAWKSHPTTSCHFHVTCTGKYKNRECNSMTTWILCDCSTFTSGQRRLNPCIQSFSVLASIFSTSWCHHYLPHRKMSFLLVYKHLTILVLRGRLWETSVVTIGHLLGGILKLGCRWPSFSFIPTWMRSRSNFGCVFPRWCVLGLCTECGSNYCLCFVYVGVPDSICHPLLSWRCRQVSNCLSRLYWGSEREWPRYATETQNSPSTTSRW